MSDDVITSNMILCPFVRLVTRNKIMGTLRVSNHRTYTTSMNKDNRKLCIMRVEWRWYWRAIYWTLRKYINHGKSIMRSGIHNLLLFWDEIINGSALVDIFFLNKFIIICCILINIEMKDSTERGISIENQGNACKRETRRFYGIDCYSELMLGKMTGMALNSNLTSIFHLMISSFSFIMNLMNILQAFTIRFIMTDTWDVFLI